ncbi:hypothetical protein NON08_14640 [Cetobacterium somerae]|uniref:hypothetical protein n=1 Tax=Cetobacterium sp. NK01 TaxID=2993530 RepID=UPI002115F45E|nr:hypothetical protein [Cetobacterium sp. NK01]MCQ8213736.1 hypothetical protein [Cetobacterium sp. NK01]
MRNIFNEEKNLKRYLKNHISLNLETMVKFLITGMIGFSLTACGGGGGGGSSDSKPSITLPQPDNSNKDWSLNKEIQEMDGVEFTEALSKGEIHEQDGKYYVVLDEENKIAQEVTVNPNMGKPEDGELPEIGAEEGWTLDKEIQEMDGVEFTEALSKGEIHEQDGKYYVVLDEENKIAQEVTVNPNMGKPEDGELPEIGAEEGWTLDKEIQEMDGVEFTEALSKGEIHEQDGKYYVVLDEENKIAQEVTVNPNMGKPEDGELPEIGAEEGWTLDKEIQEMDGVEFTEALSKGEIHEQDGKYYVVLDEENKIAQEVTVNPNMGKPEDGELPEIGEEEGWTLDKEIQEMDGVEFTEALSKGEIHEQDGKYYVVLDEENKIAQEVTVNPNMGKPEDGELPEIGAEEGWTLDKEIQEMDGVEFTEALSKGEIHEQDGKYYVVLDEENKIAQEVTVNPNMGKPEDGELPEIGAEEGWTLDKEIQEMDGVEFTEALSKGEIHEQDGKYYVVLDEENKIAQEVTVNPNMGKPEDGELPEIGEEEGWTLDKEIQEMDGVEFTEALSKGEIHEQDGKYYVVLDEENKIAQEVTVNPNMGKPEDGELPEIGEKKWNSLIVIINKKEVLLEYNDIDNNIRLDGVEAKYLIDKDNDKGLPPTIQITDENEEHNGNKLNGLIISNIGDEFLFYKDDSLVGVSDGESGVNLKGLNQYLSNYLLNDKIDLENLMENLSGIHKDGILQTDIKFSELKDYNQNYNDDNNTVVHGQNIFVEKLEKLDEITSSKNNLNGESHKSLYEYLKNSNSEIIINDITYSIKNGENGGNNIVLVNFGNIVNSQISEENGINLNYGNINVSSIYGQNSVSGNNYNYGNINVLSSLLSYGQRSYLGVGENYNYGNISISSTSSSYGQRSEKNNYNYGTINVSGTSSSTSSSYGQSSGNNYNYGDINVSGVWTSYGQSSGHKNNNYNYGNISILSDSSDKLYGQNAFTGNNYNYGNISVSGTSNLRTAYGQYSGNNNYNYGNITLSGNSGSKLELGQHSSSNNYNYGWIQIPSRINTSLDNVFGGQYSSSGNNYNYGNIALSTIKGEIYGQRSSNNNYNYGNMILGGAENFHGQRSTLGSNYNYGNMRLSQHSLDYGMIWSQYSSSGNNYNYGNILISSRNAESKGQYIAESGNNYNYGIIDMTSIGGKSLFAQYTSKLSHNYNYGIITISAAAQNYVSYGQYSSSSNSGNNYNYGTINALSSELSSSYGQESRSSQSSSYNYGNINVSSLSKNKSGYGMFLTDGAKGYNYGVIDLDNSIYDTDKDGIIEGDRFITGIVAGGSGTEAYNYGTIRTNAITGIDIKDNLGNSFDRVFMQGVSGGMVYNYGILENTNALATLSLGSGINSSTSAGYKAAGDFKLAGEMNIMAETGKGDSYIKENFITAGGNIVGLENLTTQGVYEIAASENKNEDNKNVIDLTMNKVKNIEDTVSGYYSDLIKNVGLDNYVYGEGNGSSKFAELVNKLVSTGKTADLESIFSNEYANLNGVILENSLRNSTAQSNLKDTKETYIEANGGTYDSDFTGNVSGVLAEDYLGSYKIGIFTDTQKKESKKVSNTVSYDRESYLLMGSKSLSENTGLTLSYEYSKNKYDNGAKLSTNYFGAGLYSGKKFDSFNYTFLSDAIIGLNTMERSSTDADFNSYSISMTNRIEKPFDLSMMNLSAIGEIKTTLFGHEKIEQSGADLESSRNVTVDSKTNISNNLILGMKGSKNFNSLITFDFFAGYEKELNNANEWRDTFSLTELGSSEYATPVRKEKYGAIVGEIGIQFNLNNNFTIKGKVSGDSIGDKKATMGLLYKF